MTHWSQSGSLIHVWAGYMSGLVSGGGVSGFFWMNPYVALSLSLGGFVLYVVALKAAENTR